MAKYVIDIPDDIYQIILMDGIGQTCSFHRKVDLMPYTDIDIKEKAEEFSRGYDEGWDAGSKFHEAEKESIEDEVWEFAKYVTYDMDHNDYIKCFDEIGKMHYSYNYQEAKAKYEAWKKEKDYRQDREKVIALADDIGIHNLYTLVRDIRGE